MEAFLLSHSAVLSLSHTLMNGAEPDGRKHPWSSDISWVSEAILYMGIFQILGTNKKYFYNEYLKCS